MIAQKAAAAAILRMCAKRIPSGRPKTTKQKRTTAEKNKKRDGNLLRPSFHAGNMLSPLVVKSREPSLTQTCFARSFLAGTRANAARLCQPPSLTCRRTHKCKACHAFGFLGARNILASPVIPVNATQLQAGAPLPEMALITCAHHPNRVANAWHHTSEGQNTTQRDRDRSTERAKNPDRPSIMINVSYSCTEVQQKCGTSSSLVDLLGLRVRSPLRLVDADGEAQGREAVRLLRVDKRRVQQSVLDSWYSAKAGRARGPHVSPTRHLPVRAIWLLASRERAQEEEVYASRQDNGSLSIHGARQGGVIFLRGERAAQNSSLKKHCDSLTSQQKQHARGATKHTGSPTSCPRMPPRMAHTGETSAVAVAHTAAAAAAAPSPPKKSGGMSFFSSALASKPDSSWASLGRGRLPNLSWKSATTGY